MCLAGPWHGKANQKWVEEPLTSNRYVPLGDLLDTRRFRAADDLITYPECSAFVEFLVEKIGWPKVRNLYRGAKGDGSAADFERAFKEACGEDLTTAENRFKSWARSAGA